MEIIKQEKVKPIQERVSEIKVNEIKNFAQEHTDSVRKAINKLKDRDFMTSTKTSDSGEPYLVVVRLK